MGSVKEKVPGEALDVAAYMRGYNAVFEYQTTIRLPNGCMEGRELYDRLESYLKGVATAVYEEARDLPDSSIIEFYNEQWDKWNHAAKKNRDLLRYFERHWIRREMAETKQGAKRSDIYEVVDLHMKLWVSTVFEPLEGRLNRAGDEHGIKAKGIDGGTLTTHLVHIDLWTMDTSQSYKISDAAAPVPHRPLVRYGQDVMRIPGNTYGKKFKYAGNISHTWDVHGSQSFPRLSGAELVFRDGEKANRLANFLKGIKASFLGGQFDGYTNVVTLHEGHVREDGRPALETEAKSTAKMNAVKEPMGKDILNYLMGKRILPCDSSPMDDATASDPAIYQRIEKCVFVLLDSTGDLIPCLVSRLFQHLFSTALMEKLTAAAKQWTAIPPLGATQPKELEERPIPLSHEAPGHRRVRDLYRVIQCPAYAHYDGRFVPQLGDAARLRGQLLHRAASRPPLIRKPGGDLYFPQLGLKLDYKLGGCVMFRGAELEYCVQDWHGPRMFVLCTNHQAVRNLADRRAGKLPSNPWHRPCRPEGLEAEGGTNAAADADADDAGLLSGEDENEYDPCVTEEVDVEKPPEGGRTDADIHGAGTWDPAKNAYPMEPPKDERSTGSSLSRMNESGTTVFSDSKRQRLE
ncbi:hypothetical protein DL769_002896 [Monosporascus sp. CRB-8-3]|nr:hypothetical protein DL769_002896 [Monosporascus sp. CRB-8-3]